MGLVIITNEPTQTQTPEKNPNCTVCTAERPEGFVNDLEKIFHVLQNTPVKDMVNADDLMCEFHKKKAQSLKIFSSKDELFELNSESANRERPLYHTITEDEYNKEAEIDEANV
jgi:hypothetical protein